MEDTPPAKRVNNVPGNRLWSITCVMSIRTVPQP